MRLLPVLLLLFIPFQGIAQNLEWAKSIGNSTGYQIILSVTSDTGGNIYATGPFQGTVDFNPGTGTAIATSQGFTDIFVTKFSSDGNFEWAKTFGGNLSDRGNSILIDKNNDIYVTGHYKDTVDFDPGITATNLISSGAGAFILKLDTNGDFIWARSVGDAGTTKAQTSTLDISNNIIISGEFNNTQDFDPGANVFNLTSAGGATTNTFTLKLNSNGDFIWANSIVGTSWNRPYSIATDSRGNIYTSGTFVNTADFDPGTGITNFTSLIGQEDMYIQKMDSNGVFLWVKTQGGATSSDDINNITIDKSDNLLISGWFEGITDFNPNTGTYFLNSTSGLSGFVQKLDEFGNFLWANKIGRTGHSIQSDSLGDIYIVGQYFGTSYFNPSSPNDSLIDYGTGDAYILKLDSSGSFIKANSLNGAGHGWPNSLELGPKGEIIIGGHFYGNLSFNENPNPPTLTSSNIVDDTKVDMYIFKLSSIIGVGVHVTKNKFSKEFLQLYPNPTSNKLSISNNKLIPNKIEILTITGKLITPLNPKEHSFDISNLKSGVYLLRISYDNQIITEKFIKQ